MALADAVGKLTTTQTPTGTSGGSYVAIAPNLALSAGHSFVGFNRQTGQFADFAAGSVELGAATGVVGSIDYLRDSGSAVMGDPDPYIAAGVYAKVTVKPFKKVLP